MSELPPVGRTRPDRVKRCLGNTKLTSVMTRNVSEQGVSVECPNGASIPLPPQ